MIARDRPRGLEIPVPARDRFRLRLAEHGDVDLAVLVVGRTGQWFHRR